MSGCRISWRRSSLAVGGAYLNAAATRRGDERRWGGWMGESNGRGVNGHGGFLRGPAIRHALRVTAFV